MWRETAASNTAHNLPIYTIAKPKETGVLQVSKKFYHNSHKKISHKVHKETKHNVTNLKSMSYDFIFFVFMTLDILLTLAIYANFMYFYDSLFH